MARQIVNWKSAHTEHIDDDRGFQSPWWWKEDTKPCNCSCNVKCTHRAVGYSDFLYYEVECLECKHTWCLYIEG